MRGTLGALVFLVAAGCASGGAQHEGGDDQPVVDASSGPRKDASDVTLPIDAPAKPIDASVAIDGSVTPIDAAGPGADAGLFCTVNSQCTDVGTCCLTLGGPAGFCVPGTAIGDICFPDT